MHITEFVVWSAMLGGLLTLAGIAAANAFVTRNINSVRYLTFVVVTGASSLMRTGLPEALFPDAPEDLLHLLKVCTGPLSAALVLHYLGIWLGGPEVDPVTHGITRWGSSAMLVTAGVLGTLVASGADMHLLLNATAVVTVVAVALGLLTSVRAALLGDPLAPWVVLAGACLTIEVLGLWARSLSLEGFGLGTWILTAVCTVAYFMVGSIVVVKRIRRSRELERLSTLEVRADPTTGLPTGSVLLAEVAHAFWRTARLDGICTVVCLRLNNLYGLGASDERTVEPQILSAMAARIRRAVGFRCVVGLYHPRCFVVVISANQRRECVGLTVARLRSLTAQPLTVTGRDGTQQDFWPRVGLGVVTIEPKQAEPAQVIDEAERLALGPPLRQGRMEDNIATRPAGIVATTDNATL